jgi:deoxyribodipyrimidine photo-lyase
MDIRHKKAVFIFRRDLRLDDNTGLIHALMVSDVVIPCFIFDPRQIEGKNAYRSMNAIQFMTESLDDLELQLKAKKGQLYRFYGVAEDVIEQLIKKEDIDAIFVNRDYTPFSLKRDEKIKNHCYKHQVTFYQDNDLLINGPEKVVTANGTPYQIFTPFYRRAAKESVRRPQKIDNTNFYTKPITSASAKNKYLEPLKFNNKNLHIHGGRKNAEKILNRLKAFKNYAQTHNYPAKPTTHLSAYLKFGCISVREAYDAISNVLGPHHPLLRQLYWRDFFTHVAYFSPFVFGQPYHKKFANLKWVNNKKMFNAWAEGKTGFPIVDAGMRQLNTTGFMHNRVRMIVGSFLVKDLHIDWRWGEQYFAQQLVDYDPSVNNGNWQWVASTGSDRQPYFRIFNPWLQQKKSDPHCIYTKQWVPELKKLTPHQIHNLFKEKIKIKGYPQPIIDHFTESKRAKAEYRALAKGL